MSVKGLPALVDTLLTVGKKRVDIQVRSSHLKRNGETDEDTQAALEYLNDVEGFLKERITRRLREHPAYPWFSRVKGIGDENIAKIIGLIDISRAPTISSLWKFAGYAVNPDGTAPRMTRGTKLTFNKTLRTMCYRTAGSFLKADARGGSLYGKVYYEAKEAYRKRYLDKGWKIIPSAELPKDSEGKHREQEGIISEGHIHLMAVRKMMKLFLAHLWLVWRQAEGLAIREPYVAEKLGHTSISDPWDFVEKPEKKRRTRKEPAIPEATL